MEKKDDKTNSGSFFCRALSPCRNEAGISAVETGATMLLFLIALFSVIEFGWFFLHQNTLTKAVRDGIRLGAIGSSLDDGGGNPMSHVVYHLFWDQGSSNHKQA